MKKVIQVVLLVGTANLLTGCLGAVAPIVAGGVAGNLLQNKMLAKQSESKPPKQITISQQGRIITASFKVSGFSGMVSHRQGAQVRGFHEWATAVVVSEAPKRGCVNVINAFSAGQGAKVSGSKVSNKLQFKCLDKENMMSENDLLEDKQVLYTDQLQYIKEHPEMVVYK